MSNTNIESIPPELWWSPSQGEVIGRHWHDGSYDVIGGSDYRRDTAELSKLPADAVRLVLAAEPGETDRADDELCSCCQGDPNTVCDACGRHQCWAGGFMCENARSAGTRQQHPQDRERIAQLLADLRLSEVEWGTALALSDRWDLEQATYPDNEIGRAAAAAVRLCARELRAALGSTEEGS